jgi:hypothetical protein
MARSRSKPAAEIDFSDSNQAREWFGHQPRDMCIALAIRSALRVLPLINEVRGAKGVAPGLFLAPVVNTAPDTQGFAPGLALPLLRACFVVWAIAKDPFRRDRMRSVITATAAADNARATHPYAFVHAVAAAATAASTADARNAGYAAIDAARTAFVDDKNYIFHAFWADAIEIEQAGVIAEIIAAPLWLGEMPERIAEAWDRLRTWMLIEDEANSWHPWVLWYNRVLNGEASYAEAFDLAVASLTDEEWNEEPRPAAVNRRIAALLAEHTPPDPIPPQGPGPHVVLNAAGKLDQAPPEDIDAAGNNLARIRQLLPVQRGAVADLLAHLASTDAFSQLASVVRDYRDAIAADETRIAWGTVFGLGVRLDNAALAAHRQIDDRLAPSLEDAALEALDTVLRLHGPLILSTHDGRELSEIADDFARRPEQQIGMRLDAEAIVAGFKQQPEIIEPNFKRLIEDAAETVGEGNRPERGAAYWTALARNLATVAVPASALGTLSGLLLGSAGASAVPAERQSALQAGCCFRRTRVSARPPSRSVRIATVSWRPCSAPRTSRPISSERKQLPASAC